MAPMTGSWFAQPPIAYFQPLESPPELRAASFISCERALHGGSRRDRSGLTYFETISSKVCGWAGELGQDHDLRKGADLCDNIAWLLSEHGSPLQVGNSDGPKSKVQAELPSSALIPVAQRQERVDFLSSASAVTSIFRALHDQDSPAGVLVHRLGNWLVMDDGTEIMGCDSAPLHAAAAASATAPAASEADDEQQSCSEQRREAACSRVKSAQAKVLEAEERLESARAAVLQAEADLRSAQEALEEAQAEAVADLEAQCGDHPTERTTRSHPSAPPPPPDDVPGAHVHTEEMQLYRNFLGHSIRCTAPTHALQDEPFSELEAAASAGTSAASDSRNCDADPIGGKLVAVRNPPGFRQVGVWRVADDASVVVGSHMLCLGNAEHPKLALYLHKWGAFSDDQLVEHCVECLIAGVPEFAVCFHCDGAVKSYTLYNLADLWPMLEKSVGISRKLQMTLEVLRWMKRQCCYEGCTYWLGKAASEPKLKLFQLSTNRSRQSGRRHQHQRQQLALPAGYGPQLVLKNTFLHTKELDEPSEFRRSHSCPARADAAARDEDSNTEEQEAQCQTEPVEPMRGRIAALFYRRAVSSAPGDASAGRFFRLALDMEISSPGGQSQACSHQVKDEDASGQSKHSDADCCGGSELHLKAICHLGLAMCLVGRGSFENSDTGSLGSCSSPETRLLQALRREAPQPTSPSSSLASYRLVPWRGLNQRLPLLYAALPPAPHIFAGAAEKKGLRESGESNALLSALAATHRLHVALRLVGTGRSSLQSSPSAPQLLSVADQEELEAVAYPLAAVTLLQLASALGRLANQEAYLCGPEGRALAWRALRMSRQFAIMMNTKTERPVVLQPFFEGLPQGNVLLIRIEHVAAGLLRLQAWEPSDGSGSIGRRRQRSSSRGPVDAALPFVSSSSSSASSLGIRAEELEGALQKLETWLAEENREEGMMDAKKKFFGGVEKALPPGAESEEDLYSLSALDASRPRHELLMQAVWHYDHSILLLSSTTHHSKSLLDSMMLTFSVALSEAAATSLDDLHVAAVKDDATCELMLQRIVAADAQLAQAEVTAEAAGRSMIAELAHGSRGHLRGLAADVLVSKAVASQQELAETVLSNEAAKALRILCADSVKHSEGERSDDIDDTQEEHLSEERTATEAEGDGEDEEEEWEDSVSSVADDEEDEEMVSYSSLVGKLGDMAISMSLEARQGLDTVIEPDAASLLGLMSSSALQASVVRLASAPPPTLPEVEWRQHASTLLTQSMQFLTQTSHIPGISGPGSAIPGGGSGAESRPGRLHASAAARCPLLTAHAHLLQAEMHCPLATAQPHHGQQRIACHLDRARAAIHSMASQGPSTRHPAASVSATVLLIHLHLAQARGQAGGGRSSGSWSALKQLEQVWESTLAGCEASSSLPSSCFEKKGETQRSLSSMECIAAQEACNLLLQRLLATLRSFCAREDKSSETAAPTSCSIEWKELYRAVLRMAPGEVTSVPTLYRDFVERSTKRGPRSASSGKKKKKKK